MGNKMEKSEKNTMFEKYCKMIQKKAWEVSKKTGVDYKELEAQGYYLYCEALETWDCTKSSFSTHLYYNLLQLDSYIEKDIGYSRGRKTEELNEVLENQLETPEEQTSLKNILELAKKILTSKSYNIIEWILNRVWESESVHKPTISACCRYFNLTRKEVEISWNEIKNFWNNEGIYLYS